MANRDIRRAAKAYGVPFWRIAKSLKISEPTMTRMLREELPEPKKAEIMTIITALGEEG